LYREKPRKELISSILPKLEQDRTVCIRPKLSKLAIYMAHLTARNQMLQKQRTEYLSPNINFTLYGIAKTTGLVF